MTHLGPPDAARFLSCLTGTDGWTTPCTFQTYPEAAGAPTSLATAFHGSLHRLAFELSRRNDRGAAIAVTVNETDGWGRRGENIRALRALFIDCDGPLQRTPALQPSMVVRTRRGEHLYWLLHPGEDLRRFRGAQRQLARYYGSDSTVSDMARAMRLPGFRHMKHDPVLVRLLDADPSRRYVLDEILSAHPAAGLPAPRNHFCNRVHRPCAHALYRRWAAAAPLTVGSRNAVAFRLALEGVRAQLDPAIVEAEVRAFCSRAGIVDEAEQVLRSACRANGRALRQPSVTSR
jgi:hypothetical protein